MTARVVRDLWADGDPPAPERRLCDDRAGMTDDEFWGSVFPQPEPFDDGEPDLDTVQLDAIPCRECGEVGACAYDSEGRALIHGKGTDDDD